MAYVDFILNLAGLLLWLNWRSARFDPLAKRPPATLMGTLRPAAPRKFHRWHLPGIIAFALLLRAGIYHWLAPFWVGKLNLIVTVPPFRSDSLTGMLVFSGLSFGRTLGIFYLWLLPLSLLNGPEPIQRLVKIPLGRVADWPRAIKFILPLVVTAVAWWLLGWLLEGMKICPTPVSPAHRLEQALVIGLGSYLMWKFPLGALLTLHLLNSYVYFGNHPFWNYVNHLAQTILRPFKKYPLRVGKVDFAAVVGIVIVFLAAHFVEAGLKTRFFSIPGLADLYVLLPL